MKPIKKFNMGNVPTTYKREVLIPLHGGGEASMSVDFKYRSRSDYAKFVDEIIADAVAKDEVKTPVGVDENSEEAKQITMQAIVSAQNDNAVEAMLKIADGWDLAEKFNKASLTEMQDKFPNAFVAINEAYRLSSVDGRLKN